MIDSLYKVKLQGFIGLHRATRNSESPMEKMTSETIACLLFAKFQEEIEFTRQETLCELIVKHGSAWFTDMIKTDGDKGKALLKGAIADYYGRDQLEADFDDAMIEGGCK